MYFFIIVMVPIIISLLINSRFKKWTINNFDIIYRTSCCQSLIFFFATLDPIFLDHKFWNINRISMLGNAKNKRL